MSSDISSTGKIKVKDGDLAYLRLRQMIVNLKLEPGSSVDEIYLSKLLDLGRTPIREALIRLSQDDLVSIVPRKGTVIAPINFTELKEVEELRWLLETQAVRWAAQRISDLELNELEHLLARAHAGDFKDKEDWDVEVDRNFHQLIAKAAENRHLETTLNRLYNLSIRLFYASRAQMADVSEELYDYQEIVTALRQHKPEAAAKGMEKHLVDSRNRIAEMFSSKVLIPS